MVYELKENRLLLDKPKALGKYRQLLSQVITRWLAFEDFLEIINFQLIQHVAAWLLIGTDQTKHIPFAFLNIFLRADPFYTESKELVITFKVLTVLIWVFTYSYASLPKPDNSYPPQLFFIP